MSTQDQTTTDLGTAVDASLLTTDILAVAEGIPEISHFVEALKQAGFEAELRLPELRTLFAPSNEALEAAPEGFWAKLKEPANHDRLAAILSLHIVHGRQIEADLRTATTLKSLSGEPIEVEYRDAGSKFGNAHITKHDIVCSNGNIHIVDRLVVREYSYSG